MTRRKLFALLGLAPLTALFAGKGKPAELKPHAKPLFTANCPSVQVIGDLPDTFTYNGKTIDLRNVHWELYP